MPQLQDLCHLAYGPLASRLSEPHRISEEQLVDRGLQPVLVLSGQDFDAEGYPVTPRAGESRHEAGQLALATPDLIDTFGVSPQTLLYLAKGSQHRACLPRFDSELPLLTGSSFIRLEIGEPARVVPEYLFAQLRSSRTWRQLEVRQEGAFIKNINRHALAELVVHLDPPERQRAVVEYTRLHRRARQLRERLDDLERQRLNNLLNPDQR